ncbi:hypothetical protein [Chitinimonas lacunae]|uniref:Uncharacterized protein n=1 Tax=Chitinimonas lacunae TaxID=1963018 RepID=A0ABV8MM14_9NEIS
MNLSLSLIYFLWRKVGPRIASRRQGTNPSAAAAHHALSCRAY